MLSNLVGEVRTRINRLTGGDIKLRLTGWQSMPVAPFELQHEENTRAGVRFFLGNNAAITGIAPVQALVTTAAQWALFNTDATNGRTAYLDELGVYLTSGTPGVGGILMGCLFALPAQSGLAAGAAISGGSKPQGVGTGSIIAVKSGVSITSPAAPNWYPIASNPSPNVTAFAGSTFLEHRALAGKLAIPPQFGLGLAVVAPAGTTPLFAPFGSWVERASDLE